MTMGDLRIARYQIQVKRGLRCGGCTQLMEVSCRLCRARWCRCGPEGYCACRLVSPSETLRSNQGQLVEATHVGGLRLDNFLACRNCKLSGAAQCEHR